MPFVMVGAIAIIVALLPAIRVTPGPSLFLLTFATIWTLLALSHLLTHTRRERVAAHITATLLRRHRCASCGYGLSGSRVTADAFVSCPECDAHWSPSRLECGTLQPGDVVPPAAPVPPELKIPDPRLTWLARFRLAAPYGYDANGRMVPIVHYRLHGANDRATTPSAKARLALARAALRPHPIKVALMTVLGIVFAAGLAFQLGFVSRPIHAILAADPTSVSWERLSGLAGPIFMCALMLFVGSMVLFRLCTRPAAPRPKRVVNTMLMHGLCASCAADLEPVLIVDGACTCPSCGAMWQ